MRTAFDNNTLISAIIKKGSVPDLALKEAVLFHQILVSLKTLDGLNSVLQRKKFDVYLKEESRQNFCRSFVRLCELIDTKSVVCVCRDAKDNKFLELCLTQKQII